MTGPAMIYKDDFACFFELLKQVVQWFDGILGSCIKPNHCQPHVFVPFSQIGASRGSLWSDPVVQLKRYLCPFLFGAVAGAGARIWAWNLAWAWAGAVLASFCVKGGGETHAGDCPCVIEGRGLNCTHDNAVGMKSELFKCFQEIYLLLISWACKVWVSSKLQLGSSVQGQSTDMDNCISNFPHFSSLRGALGFPAPLGLTFTYQVTFFYNCGNIPFLYSATGECASWRSPVDDTFCWESS